MNEQHADGESSNLVPGDGEGLPWLLSWSSPEPGQRLVRCGERCVIGRAPGVDVYLDDPAIAGRHLAVSARPDRVELHCLDASSAVYVGGAPVQRAELDGADVHFVVGDTAVCLSRVLEQEVQPTTSHEPIPGLVGTSRAMRELTRQVRQWARLSAPVLLQGESGTGKDVVARALHDLSARSGRFVAVNVGAMGDALADSELFGHRRGAFTGALTSRTGVFEEADGGTLFLDEVADLSPAVQVKFLRVLEERRFRSLGSSQDIAMRCRVVTACWASLAERAESGRFRCDLFHRISTVTLRIPPLRERRGDIPALAVYLLARFRSELGDKQLAPGALGLLLGYGWPGNVRELSSVLYRAAAGTPGSVIAPATLQAALPRVVRKVPRINTPLAAAELLARHGGNVSAAARAADMPRTTFRALLARNQNECLPTEDRATAGVPALRLA